MTLIVFVTHPAANETFTVQILQILFYLISFIPLYISSFLYFISISPFSETFSITSSPARETIVVEGVNSSRVSLVWKYSLAINETISTITFFRRLSSSERDVRIAIKRESEQFSYNSEEFKARYEALSSSQAKSATLVLLDVKNSEEYRYTLRIFTNQDIQRHRTSLVVYGQ